MKIEYKPEIDGLRAIAVVAVILYHAKINLFSYQLFEGGFIGVDIFFVISGYLITSIILKEMILTNSFSFSDFYIRRIRRILPVLLFIMLVSLPFAWIYLLPSTLIDFSKSLLYSLGFSSNFYFHYSGQIYGAESGLLKPFLHTWSLSVEEQYYILFPGVLFIIFKYFKRYLGITLFIFFIISLYLADWGSKNYPSFSFYALPTRGWEVLAGSILAYLEVKLGYRSKSKVLSLILPGFGLLLIVHSIFFFDHKISHPSFYTLYPVIGVCSIIWFSNKNELITKILSSKLLVGTGLISYSLYLWHYPIFAFARTIDFTSGELFKIVILLSLVIFFSVLSYFLIERPARNKHYKSKSIILYILVSIFIISSFCFLVIYKKGRLNIKNTSIENLISSPLHKSECKYSTGNSNFLTDDFFKNDFDYCYSKNKKFILVLGDSHSIDLFNSLAKNTGENEFIIGLNKNHCRPLENKTECQYFNALKFIKNYKNKIKYVIYTQKGSYFLTNNGNKNDLGNSLYRKLPINYSQINKTIEYLNQIKKETKSLIFIGPHLEPNVLLTGHNLKNFVKNKFLNISSYDNTNKDLIKVDNELKKIFRLNNIDYISKIDSINFVFKKDFVVNSKLTFSDTDHWSDFGEIYFGRKLIDNSKLKYILTLNK